MPVMRRASAPQMRAHLPELACLLLFAAVSLFGLMHHELWRDELQSWLIVRDSHSLSQLLENIRYDGHPALWFLALYALPDIQSGFVPAQVLHYLIALSSAALLLFFSPFSRLERCLLLSGYFMLYEYTAIARNYGLGALLLWAFCLSCRHSRHSAWLPGVLLALLANTSMMGCLTAIAGVLALAAAALSGEWAPRSRASLGAGFALAAAGILAAAVTMAPPADLAFGRGWLLAFDPERLAIVAGGFARAWLPVTDPELRFWDHWGIPWALKLVLFVIALATVGLFARRLAPVRHAQVFFVSGTGALLVFFYCGYPGYMRHHGFLFLVLVAALWLYRQAGPSTKGPRSGDVWMRRAFVGLLVVHAVAGVTAIGLERRYVFSGSAQVADYIRTSAPGLPLSGYPDFIVGPVLAQLNDRPQAYFLNGSRWGSFVRWDRQRAEADPMPAETLEARLCGFAAAERRNVLVLLSLSNRVPAPRCGRLHLRMQTSDTVVENESYALYELAYAAASAVPSARPAQ